MAEFTPVVVGIQTTPSIDDLGFWESVWLRILKFFNADDDEDNSYSLWKPEKSDKLRSGHAVYVTGYDDNKFGGAFRLVNSRGKNWVITVISGFGTPISRNTPNMAFRHKVIS